MYIVVPFFVSFTMDRYTVPCRGVPHNHPLLDRLIDLAVSGGGRIAISSVVAATAGGFFGLKPEGSERCTRLAELLPQQMLEDFIVADGLTSVQVSCQLDLGLPDTEEVRKLVDQLAAIYPDA